MDKKLRSRVKLFGNLLGNILRAQAGDQVFAAVETLRKDYVSRRKKDDPNNRNRLKQIIKNHEPSLTTHEDRAFSTYFSMLNLAVQAFYHIHNHHTYDTKSVL